MSKIILWLLLIPITKWNRILTLKEVYVVKFTKDQLDRFNRGDINFQKTSDMKSLLPNFVSKGTNNEIVSMARLEKIVLNNPEALQKLCQT